MAVINGTITYALLHAGSKSEGKVAIVTTDDGTTYKLYRAATLPAGDTFFAPFDGQRIGVVGKVEEESGYFLVEALQLTDGTEIRVPEIISQPAGGSIFLDGGTRQDVDDAAGNAAGTADDQAMVFVGRGRRLPRKLKKRLKRENASGDMNRGK